MSCATALRLPLRTLRCWDKSSGARRRHDDAIWTAHPCAGDLFEELSGVSYERLRFLFRDAFGLIVSEGALMNMFIRSHAGFKIEADKAKAILRKAKVVASDETGVRIEGDQFLSLGLPLQGCGRASARLFTRRPRRGETMGGHQPEVWISDRYSAQQKHGAAHQTCLAHLARDTAFALEHGSDDLPLRFKLWFGKAFDLAAVLRPGFETPDCAYSGCQG